MRAGGAGRGGVRNFRISMDLFDELERRHRQVDLVGVMLVYDGRAAVRVDHDLANRRGEVAEHEFGERGLSVAVLAEEHDTALGGGGWWWVVSGW